MASDPLPPDVNRELAEFFPAEPARPTPPAIEELATAPLAQQFTRPGFGFWGAVGLVILWLALQVAGAVGYFVVAGLNSDDMATIIQQIEIPGTVLVFLSTVVLTLVACRGRARRVLALRPCSPLQLIVVLLLVLPMTLAELSVAESTSRLLDRDVPSPDDSDEGLSHVPSRAVPPQVGMTISEIAESIYGRMADRSWPVVLFFFCLLPAVGEEPFFRGLLGQGLTARYGMFGVLLASIMFGIQHLSPDHVGATILLGVIAQLVYLATKSLAAPIVLHFLNNLIAIGPDKYQRDFELDSTGFMQFDAGIPIEITTASALAAGALLLLLYGMRTRWILPDGEVWSPGYLTAEMPPAELGAVAKPARPAAGLVFVALLAWAAFAAVYVWQAFSVLPAVPIPA